MRLHELLLSHDASNFKLAVSLMYHLNEDDLWAEITLTHLLANRKIYTRNRESISTFSHVVNKYISIPIDRSFYITDVTSHDVFPYINIRHLKHKPTSTDIQIKIVGCGKVGLPTDLTTKDHLIKAFEIIING